MLSLRLGKHALPRRALPEAEQQAGDANFNREGCKCFESLRDVIRATSTANENLYFIKKTQIKSKIEAMCFMAGSFFPFPLMQIPKFSAFARN